jgi:hypothetical protein
MTHFSSSQMPQPPNECVHTHSPPNHYTLRPIPLNPAIQPGGGKLRAPQFSENRFKCALNIIKVYTQANIR